VPAIEIAGLCLPLKPQKESVYADCFNKITFTNPLLIDDFLLRNVAANG